ncbi:MAG: hypothetical protein AB9872_10990 [Solidesulfovibrio sp.]
MPSDKPLPDTNDDIIDLTDLVEAGSAGGKSSGDDGPVDMSFEKELDDLFGDVEPAPSKAASPTDADDDLIDLAGLELADEAEKAPEAPAADDDIMDLAGLGIEEIESEEVSAPADETPGPDFDSLDELEEKAPAQAADTLEMEGLGDNEPAQAPETDEAIDISEMNLGALAPEGTAAEAPADDDMSRLLGDLPETDAAARDEALNVAELSGLPSLEDAAPAETAVADTTGSGAMAMTAMAAVATAGTVGGIDLGALDHLIDSAKGPMPEPEEEQPAPEALAALVSRLEALETAAFSLAEKLETASAAPDDQALAAAVVAQLEHSLDARLEELLLNQPPAPDLDALKEELLAEIGAGKPDHDALLAELQQALAPQFESLRQDLLPTGESATPNADIAAVLEGLRESLARLEALSQGRQTQFEDFASTMETRLAELRRELPEADAFVSPQRLTEALDELRETLAADIAANLDGQLAGVVETARQAAREEVSTLAEALESRIVALEADRIDPDALAERVRESLTPASLDSETLEMALANLRTEMTAEMERAVPRAAAAVIREEIAALAKEFM